MLEQDPQKSCGDTAVIKVHFAATAKYRENMAREIHRMAGAGAVDIAANLQVPQESRVVASQCSPPIHCELTAIAARTTSIRFCKASNSLLYSCRWRQSTRGRER